MNKAYRPRHGFWPPSWTGGQEIVKFLTADNNTRFLEDFCDFSKLGDVGVFGC